MKTDCPDCRWDIEGRMIHGWEPCEPCRVATLKDSGLDVSPAFVFHNRIRAYQMAVLEWEHGGKVGPRPTIEFPEAEEDDAKLPRMKWPETPNYCFRCNKDMRESTVRNREPAPWGDELDNECTITFSGGYGSFIDSFDKWPTLTICHECGHQLAEWLGVDCRNYHTHSIHGGQHADHHDNQERFSREP